jgi:hypothetical protein
VTANELVEYIAEDLNTPSQEAKNRIGHALNVRYKQVTSSIGLIPTRRIEVEAAASVGDRFVTFADIEKIDVVFYKSSDVDPGAKATPLTQVTHDEMLKLSVRDEPPTRFCVYNVEPTTVTIQLDCLPASMFILYASGLASTTTLTNNDQPAFPESFHDILIHGVKADEYRRREKANLAKEAEMMFEKRLSDLRMFLAKSAYLDIYRGKHTPAEGWWDYESRKY